jgi:hypothetical protein
MKLVCFERFFQIFGIAVDFFKKNGKSKNNYLVPNQPRYYNIGWLQVQVEKKWTYLILKSRW